jgi:Beta-propeller repeat/S-layer homology domain
MSDFRRVPQKGRGLALLAAVASLAFAADRPQKAPAGMRDAAESVKAHVNRNFGKMPLSFEENRGQADRQVKFVSQGQGYSMFLTDSGVVLSLQTPRSPSEAGQHALIRMEFSGAKSASVTGEEQQTARSSYFVGNDPAKWVTGAANYARVRYRALYPGIDMVFYGNQRQLEYDLVVAPGSDPGAIEMKFEGIDRLRLDSAGNLVLSAGTGEIRQHRPIVYQERDGVRQPVDGRYVIQSGNRVAFAVARYDSRRPLIVDPVLSFATYLGSDGIFNTSFDPATTTTIPAVAVDFEGSVYVTGFNGGGTASFPGPPVSLGPGGTQVYVAKMNSTGTGLLYSVVLGGGGSDAGGGIAVDGSGNAYVTGFTSSSNFPVTPGAPQPSIHSSPGSFNAFVTEVNAAGAALAYSTYLGGNGSDWGRAIAVDHSGNAYVTGTAQESIGTNFPLVNPISSSPAPGFLTEVNSTGTAPFVYSTFLSAGIGYGIAVDSTGDAYVTGTTGTNLVLTPTPTAAQGYVLKVNAGGGSLAYGPVLLGTSGKQTVGFGIALDAQNDAYVTGMTTDPAFPQITGGAAQTTYGGGLTDAFALELGSGGALPPVYGTYIGGLGSNPFPERGSGIGVDVLGNAYVAGTTQCIAGSFPAANAIAGANGTPAALMKGSLSGSTASWSATSLAGSFDQVTALAFDALGNIYAGASAFNAIGGGVYKSSNGGATWTAATTGITSSIIDAVAVDPHTPATIYAIGGGHIYQSTNSGGGWTALAQAVGSSGVLAIAPTSPSTVYAGSSAGLLYSTNSGTTWISVASVPAPVNSLAVDPSNDLIIYAATNSGVYKTTTGGTGTWNQVDTGLPAVAVTSLAVNGSSTVYAALDAPAGVYYTSNLGSNWTQAPLGEIVGTPLLVTVDALNNVYVAFQFGGVAVGTSGGTVSGDWSSLTFNGLAHNQIVALAVQPSSPYTPYAGIVSATDAFLTSISPGGGSFSFSTCIGGSDNDLGQNIAVSPTGAVFVSGATVSTNLPVTAGAVQSSLTKALYGDFVARVDNDPFVDVSPTDFFFNATNIMYELGITNGCQAVPLEFCPNDTNTRGEMAKFIVVAIEGGSNFTYNPTPYFSDVPSDAPFFSYIQKLYELGITNGCATSPSLMFCPNDGVTRDETAAFIIRARFATIPFNYPTTPYFADVPPSDPFFSYVQEMYFLGITSGCSTNPLMYCPTTILPRGEMAVFVVRGLLNQLLPVTTPILTSVTPNSAAASTPVTVTITGFGTHFSAGTSQVQTVTGVTATNIVVETPTRLTVQLTGGSGATPNPSPIVVMTGAEQAGLPVGFTVQ